MMGAADGKTMEKPHKRSFRYNIRNYTGSLALMTMSYSMIWVSLSIILPYIEKRYSLSSVQSGFIMAATEIGRLPMLFIVSHFGNKFSIPRIVAIFGIGVSIGQLLLALPHFLFSPDAVASQGYGEQFCATNSTDDVIGAEITNGDVGGSFKAFCMMVAGMIIMGMFISPVSNLAVSYIDNNADEGTAPVYLGFIHSAFGMGPVLASFIASYVVTFYVDLTPTNLTPDDPSWVGAWWLMLLIISGCVFITSPWLACYPKSMKNSRLTHKDRKDVELTDSLWTVDDASNKDTPEMETKYTVKSLFVTLWRLIRNPVFVTLCVYMVFRDLADFGYKSYFAKYLGVVYSINGPQIGIITGTSSIVSVLAYTLSGIIIKKLNLTYEGTIKMVFGVAILHIVIHVVKMNVGCENIQLMGLQPNNTTALLTSPCYDQCDCSTNFFSPICDIEQKLTYFSPCHAGCPATSDFTEDISGCACADGVDLSRRSCFQCDGVQKVVFLVFSYVEMFPFAFPFAPVTALILRGVRTEDKSLALGFSVVIVALGAWMPCAPLYGRVFDSTCTLWQMLGNNRGACWIYDLKALRYTLFGVNVGLYVLSVLCLALTWWFTRRRNVTWTSEKKEKLRRDYEYMQKIANDKKNVFEIQAAIPLL